MAIFTNFKSEANAITESFADVTATALEESFEYTGMDLDEMAMAHVAEAEANYSAIMTAIGIHEAQTFAETGEEVVYTEGTLSDIKDKIIAFVKSVWNKIVELFKRFIRMFDAWNKDDKAFLDKYKAEINKRVGRLKDFKFQGYKFTHLDRASAAVAACAIGTASELGRIINASGGITVNDEEIKRQEENYSDFEEESRGEILSVITGSNGGSLTASEFSKELFMAFRDGEESKQTLDDSDINLNTIMQELATSKTARKNAEDAYKNCKKACDTIIKNLEKADKGMLKAMTDKDHQSNSQADKDRREGLSMGSRALNLKIRVARTALSIMQTVNGAHLTALKDQSRQNKAICVKAMNGIKAESVGVWEHEIEEGASFLSGVKLI